MVEMRWVEKVGLGITQINKVETVKTKVLQYRHMKIGVDASGALCPNGGWSEWIDVFTVKE